MTRASGLTLFASLPALLCAALLCPALHGATLSAPTQVLHHQEAVAEAQDAATGLWANGQREESIDLLQRSLAHNPDDLALRRLLAEQQLAVHRYGAALDTARPAGDDLQWLCAEALFRADRFEEAVPLLDRSDPTQAVALIEALEILGRADEARRTLDEVLVRIPGASKLRTQLVRGRLLAADGRYAQAATAFRSALEQDPADPGALFGLGQALVRTGQREAGLVLLSRHRELVPLLDQLDFAQRAVDLAPNVGPNHALVGDAERAIGRIDRAQAAYELAMLLSTREQLPPIALRLARLLEDDRAQVDEALAVLDDALGAEADAAPDVRLIVRSGDLLMRAGRATEAVLRYERAQRLRPTDPAIAQRLDSARAESAASEAAARPSASEPPR